MGQIITIAPTQTLTVDTAIYASGDLIGKHSGGYLTFAKAIGVGGTKLISARLIDQAKQAAAIDLVLFSTPPNTNTLTDNGALDVSDTDLPFYLGHISFVAGSYAAFGDNNAAILNNIQLGLNPASNDKNLYGLLVSRGTPTFAAATDLAVSISVERD
jgi:hypothetical protein